MKSFIALVVFCAVLALPTWALSRDELYQKAMEMGKQCQTQEGASEQDLQEFLMHQVPSTQTGKCLRACIMETVNVLIDNVPNLENAIKLAHEFTNGNEQAIQLTRELHNECNPSAINPNRCETAFNIIRCSAETLNRRRIDPSRFYET